MHIRSLNLGHETDRQGLLRWFILFSIRKLICFPIRSLWHEVGEKSLRSLLELYHNSE